MQQSKYYIKFRLKIYIVLASILLSSCGTSQLSKLYHNFNARFNYLINARELYNKTLTEFEISKPDNYNKPEPIKIPTESEALSMSDNLDEVIKKASFIIKKHSNSTYIEETYMLVAKSNFYKLNLNNASNIFQYIYNNFNNVKIKQEAMAYNALCKMLLGLNEEANESIDIALNITKDPKEINNIIYKANSQILAHNNHFLFAAEQMNLAALYSNKNNRTELLRNKLIEAFYYKKANNNIASENIYKDIIDNNTKPKAVINNAKINYLMSLIANKTSISKIEEEVLQEINKDENKYDPLFQSQLYYLLGTLYADDKNYDKAITNFDNSVKKAGVNNLYRQAIGNKAIGDIYYENKKNFKEAVRYYDMVIAASLTNIPGYNILQIRKTNLNNINNELAAINKEDTLQNFAKLSLGEQENIADNLAKKIIAENEDFNNAAKLNNISGTSNPTYQSAGSGWYFYNNTALATAQSDFKRRWGNRNLGDRWRYSTESSDNNTDSNMAENILTSGIADNIIYDKDKLKNIILAQIPNKPEKLEESQQRAIKAYSKLIDILYNTLGENEQSISYINEMINKYPNVKNKDELYYIMAEAYSNINDNDKYNLYKNKLINNYPESKYTSILRELSNKPESIKADQELQVAYNRAFELFTNKQFDQLINEYYQNQNNKASLNLQARYAFLCALAVGKLNTSYIFKEELINIQNTYPNSVYSKEASNLIAYTDKNYENINTRKYAIAWNPNDNPNNIFNMIYYKEQQKLLQELDKIKNILKNSYFKKLNSQDTLYIAIALDKKISTDGLRLNLRLFGRNSFNNQWNIAQKDLNDNNQIIYIGPFKELKDANDYYDRLKKNQKFVIEMDPKNYETFVITNNNLALIKSRTEINDYLTYYRLTDWLKKTDF
ncbi:MAG: hypothetical protein ACQPRJ_01405 [Solitalea-like symbiont of Acarus siro]